MKNHHLGELLFFLIPIIYFLFRKTLEKSENPYSNFTLNKTNISKKFTTSIVKGEGVGGVGCGGAPGERDIGLKASMTFIKILVSDQLKRLEVEFRAISSNYRDPRSLKRITD